MNSEIEIPLRASLSFGYKHGIFLKEETVREFKLKKEDVLGVEREGLVEFEVCRKFNEINAKTEAKTLLGLFEAMLSDCYTFLSEHSLTKRLAWKSSPFPFTLNEICPELEIKRDSFFLFIYKQIEDTLIDLDLSLQEGVPRVLQKKIKEYTNYVAGLLNDFYENTDCVLGVGSHLSFLTRRPLELCFGTCGLPLGHVSKILDEGMLVNPYLLYWALSDCGHVRGKKIKWTPSTLTIRRKYEQEVPIATINLKTYIPSKDLSPIGVDTTWVNRYTHQFLLEEKPYVLENDLLFPFSCPCVVTKLNYAHEMLPVFHPTPYGRSLGQIEVPKVNVNTKITVEFFDYPLYNKKQPVVFDTSAIDVARFPLQPTDPFFEMFLKNREIVIPNVVLYELKTRLSTPDRRRVSEALVRIRCLQSWGFIRNLRHEEAIPIEMVRTAKSKKGVEDSVDFAVLTCAIKNKGILFTNDAELGEICLLKRVICYFL